MTLQGSPRFTEKVLFAFHADVLENVWEVYFRLQLLGGVVEWSSGISFIGKTSSSAQEARHSATIRLVASHFHVDFINVVRLTAHTFMCKLVTTHLVRRLDNRYCSRENNSKYKWNTKSYYPHNNSLFYNSFILYIAIYRLLVRLSGFCIWDNLVLYHQ